MIGKTGTGKSTLLRNLILQDIAAGEGVGVIDPHGDLADELLDHIPPRRTDHVVYFNPADQDFPIGLNLLHAVPQERRHLVRSGVVGAFKNIWRDSWGPRLEYILSAAVLPLLLDAETATILGVPRMLVDDDYTRMGGEAGERPDCPCLLARLSSRGMTSDSGMRRLRRVGQNKVGQLLMTPPFRNILGQVRSTASSRDSSWITIGESSWPICQKGRKLGEDAANLIGALLVNEFQLAALARADTPEKERRDFFLCRLTSSRTSRRIPSWHQFCPKLASTACASRSEPPIYGTA